MRPRPVLILLLATLALALSACTSVRQRRIENNLGIYNALTAEDQGLVSSGRIREGFSREAVFLAFGRPESVARGSSKGRETEKWEYWTAQPVQHGFYGPSMGWRRGAIGYGYGCGYCGPWDPFWSMGPQMSYMAQKVITVDFVDGRVSEFMIGPQ
jgi:hypothetical protein